MRYTFPNGLRKALTFSYDDGQQFDQKLVAIFNKYGLKGTFHLNSGILDGVTENEIFIRKDEVKELYKGHEVACHGVNHRNPPTIPVQEMSDEIGDDRKELERITGGMVQGMSYAFGNYTEKIKEIAKMHGIKYSRTVNDTCNFFPPADFLEWHPTCHHEHRLWELGEQFLHIPDFYELPIMYVWGHSFEFGRTGDWSVMEQFAQMMAGKEDIWYATNIEICRYIEAVRAMELSADEKTIYNPTAVTVWMITDAGVVSVAPGETLVNL